MGFFSWYTSDTNKSIPSHYSSRTTFKVNVITEDGQVFTEDNYEGYGVFGGKDIYTLCGEMNGHKGNTDEETRDNYFNKVWLKGVKKGNKKYTYGIDFDNYQTPIEAEGGKTANQLSEDGWESFGDSAEFSYWADLGFKMPKIVEVIQADPTNKEEWKKYWDSLEYPASCPDQGFFYPDDEDEEDNYPTFDEGEE
jgi:hypothetical protein